MFDNAHHASLPNYYRLRPTPSKSTVLLSLWRSINPHTEIFYVTVSDQLINHSKKSKEVEENFFDIRSIISVCIYIRISFL